MAPWKTSLFEKLAGLKLPLASHVVGFADMQADDSRRLQNPLFESRQVFGVTTSNRVTFFLHQNHLKFQCTIWSNILLSTYQSPPPLHFHWASDIQICLKRIKTDCSTQLVGIELKMTPPWIILFKGLKKPFYFCQVTWREDLCTAVWHTKP